MPQLKPLELRVVSLVVNGLLNKEIAHELNTSETKVKTHLKRIFNVVGVKNRTQLAVWYVTKKEQQQ